MSVEALDAYSRGIRAAQECATKNQNPYSRREQPELFHAWLAGWHGEMARALKG